jgi:hypothetical protein
MWEPTPVKIVLLLAIAFLTSTVAEASDLGAADLPRIHAEYKANQARWAREFLDKTFAATMTLHDVSNLFDNDHFWVSFLENQSDWMPGVQCRDVPPSDFLISKNKGDSIFFQGVVKDHSSGSLDLRDCEFFDSEKAASDADAKRLADDAAARDQEARQAAADGAKQIAIETAALDESARAAASASVPQPSVSPGQLQTLLLPATLNDMFRGVIQRTGKHCNAITDHVWVTTEHISVMCDRRLRAAFIHERDGWRLARPGE